MKSIIYGLVVFFAALSLSAQNLKIYTEENPPLQFTAADGTLTGFNVELVKEIQKKAGNSDKITSLPWARGYNALVNKEGFVVLFGTARTEEREKLFQWVGPVAESTYILISRADSKIKLQNLEEAKALRYIGVVNNDVRDQFLTKRGFANLDRSSDNDNLLTKLKLGRNDLMATSLLALPALLAKNGMKSEDVRVQLVLYRSPIYLAFSANTPADVVKTWQKALDELKNDGTYEKLYRKSLPGIPLPGSDLAKK